MLRSSLPLGKFLGVDIRLHVIFPVLLIAAVAYGMGTTGEASRGFAVFLALLLAVAVREIARATAAAYLGLRLRVLFLLPVGGVMGFHGNAAPGPLPEGALLWSAPVANVVVGLLMLGISYACAPGVDLLRQPWISASHLLRTFIWMQFLIALVNLLPAAAMPTRQALRPGSAKSSESALPLPAPTGAGATSFSVFSGLAVAMLLAGILTANLWLIILGGFVFLYAQLRKQTDSPAALAGSTVRVEAVMSADYIVLSNSDTIRNALDRAAGTLQEVFPIVRGDRLVGAISRQTLLDQLQVQGDSYIQGLMNRSLATALRDEPLAAALQRASSRGSATDCIAVVDGFEGDAGGRVLGLLTPQTVNRAVQQAKLTRHGTEARQTRA